jgi:hypothetical protein
MPLQRSQARFRGGLSKGVSWIRSSRPQEVIAKLHAFRRSTVIETFKLSVNEASPTVGERLGLSQGL